MLEHSTGRRILAEKPRVTPETFPVDKLLQMDPNTFGYNHLFYVDIIMENLWEIDLFLVLNGH